MATTNKAHDKTTWMTGRHRALDGLTPLRWVARHSVDERARRAAGRLARRAAA